MITYSNLIGGCTVPVGASGAWQVARFRIDEARAMYSMFRLDGRHVSAGEYTRLTRDGEIIMSDTRAEIMDMDRAFGYTQRRRWLIAGLGLGMAVRAAFECCGAQEVVVVEQSADVIALSGPTYKALYGDRLEIVQADIWDVSPKAYRPFDFAWFDIWDDMRADNLPEMARLHRRWTRYTAEYASWGQRVIQKDQRSSYYR